MVIKSRRVRFVLIVVALLTGGAAGCSAATRTPRDAEPDVAADGDADGDVDAEVDADADADAALCEPWEILESFTVAEPEAGVPADQASICGTGEEPVASNRAGRVTLNLYSASLDQATGVVEVPAELRDLVVGLPTIEATAASPVTVGEIEITDLVAGGAGFTFHATWATPPGPNPGWEYPALTLQVTFELRCDETGADTRTVTSITHLNLCDDLEHPTWVSSGDLCEVCTEICEMAPAPVLPSTSGDGTAMPRAIDLEVLAVARVGAALALVAEHRGAEGPVAYAWSASAGRLSDVAEGGTLWQPPPGDDGPHLVQVAVRDRDSAAVASFQWPPRV